MGAKAISNNKADGIKVANDRIDGVLRITAARLKAANTKRDNAWENIGLLGLFLEVRTMYLRLRSLVWGEFIKGKASDMTTEHKKRALDCLLDLRAYTVLAEMALQDNNYYGSGDDESLIIGELFND